MLDCAGLYTNDHLVAVAWAHPNATHSRPATRHSGGGFLTVSSPRAFIIPNTCRIGRPPPYKTGSLPHCCAKKPAKSAPSLLVMACYLECNPANHAYLPCMFYYLVFGHARHPVPAVWMHVRMARPDIGLFDSSSNMQRNHYGVICKTGIGTVVVAHCGFY